MKYKTSTFILSLTLVFSITISATSQKLTIEETLEYLTDLCSANMAYSNQYKYQTYTLVNKKIKNELIYRTPTSAADCTETILFDIRKLKTIKLENIKDMKGDSIFRASIYFDDKVIQYSDNCFDYARGYKTGHLYSFSNKSAALKFQKAMLYLKRKLSETYPNNSKDPFGDK